MKIIWKSRYAFMYALLFSFLIFFQCVAYNYVAYHSLPLECITKAPRVFWGFFLPKISISLFLASFVFIFRNKAWTIVVCSIISIWCMAELVYFRVNGILLDAYSFTMIGNMDGFWDSILPFLRPIDIVFILPILIVLLCYFFFKEHCNISSYLAIVLMLSALGFHMIGTSQIYKESKCNSWWDINGQTELEFYPFVDGFLGFEPITYSKFTSVVHCLFLNCIDLFKMPFSSPENVDISIGEKTFLQTRFNHIKTKPVPNTNLYIILVESLEGWVLTPEIAPNCVRFFENHDNILFSNQIKCQVAGGMSSDGQMILNTGILPIARGATCFRYPYICYPSLSELFTSTAMVQPGDMSVWNQGRMSEAYHIQDNYVNAGEEDHISANMLDSLYVGYSYMMMLTTASHTPFIRYSNKLPLPLNPAMPAAMRDYINCIHYTDSCLGTFLTKIDTDEKLNQATIVITGDHKIFDDELRRTFSEYCFIYGEDYDVQNSNCPLIIYSPTINQKTIIKEDAYQMDIYPTILHILGCDSTYYWRGFGKNLLDPYAERAILPEDAAILSDKMIRSNYWDTYKKEHNNKFD